MLSTKDNARHATVTSRRSGRTAVKPVVVDNYRTVLTRLINVLYTQWHIQNSVVAWAPGGSVLWVH